jgi:hypothetical protein
VGTILIEPSPGWPPEYINQVNNGVIAGLLKKGWTLLTVPNAASEQELINTLEEGEYTMAGSMGDVDNSLVNSSTHAQYSLSRKVHGLLKSEFSATRSVSAFLATTRLDRITQELAESIPNCETTTK